MYNESYEDYIKNILGYNMPINNSNINNDRLNNSNNNDNNNILNNSNNSIEQYYPEIYNKVYPIIKKVCSFNNRSVTKELIDQITDDIYVSVNSGKEIGVNINLGNEVGMNRNKNNMRKNTRIKTQERNSEGVRSYRYNYQNQPMRDLIKILLIQELLRNKNIGWYPPIYPPRPGPGGRPPIFPPRPGPGGRPPMPPPRPGPGGGRPPMPPPRPGGGRPPMYPRELTPPVFFTDEINDYDIYE